MIRIAYCTRAVDPEHGRSVVIAAGRGVESAKHVHGDIEHDCTILRGVAEDVPGGYPWLCGDGVTMVDDEADWIVYLERYIP